MTGKQIVTFVTICNFKRKNMDYSVLLKAPLYSGMELTEIMLAISGTPTLFFVDGDRIPGAVPIAQIEKKLDQSTAK